MKTEFNVSKISPSQDLKIVEKNNLTIQEGR